MPSPKKPSAKKTRITKTVQRRVAGQSIRKISVAHGISEKTVSRDLQDPTALALIAHAFALHKEKFEELLASAITAVGQAMTADRCAQISSGEDEAPLWLEFPGVPDHPTRLAAVDRLCRLLSLGLDSAPPTHESARLEWHQLVELIEENLPENKK